jgi:hypothetical protein
MHAESMTALAPVSTAGCCPRAQAPSVSMRCAAVACGAVASGCSAANICVACAAWTQSSSGEWISSTGPATGTAPGNSARCTGEPASHEAGTGAPGSR